MAKSTNPRKLVLPGSWSRGVRSALLHVVSLAQYAAVYTRSWAAESRNARVRLKADNDQLEQEVALLRAEIRLKDARMACLPALRRPHYPPAERLEILELRAARGWSLEQTADVFLVTAATIRSWMNRLEETGPKALVQLRTPVNKFPEFVRYAVQQLQTLCPTLGKKKLADILARAGLHLAVSTVARFRRDKPQPTRPLQEATTCAARIVTANRPNHVWHVDLTTIPTQAGFWCSWLPCALPQCWPFCWWVAAILDHYSRRVMDCAAFRQAPSAVALRCFFGRALRAAEATPRYLVSDKGSQFWPTTGYRLWCRRKGIRPRFGAVGKCGSIAVLERWIKTLKYDLLRGLPIPLRHQTLQHQLRLQIGWYNEHRPHMTLKGQTPNEVYLRRSPAHRRPRLEPRLHWPRGSPCARPQVLVAGQPGNRFTLDVQFHGGQRALPIVTLRRAA
jgi:transposase InsO family protein